MKHGKRKRQQAIKEQERARLLAQQQDTAGVTAPPMSPEPAVYATKTPHVIESDNTPGAVTRKTAKDIVGGLKDSAPFDFRSRSASIIENMEHLFPGFFEDVVERVGHKKDDHQAPVISPTNPISSYSGMLSLSNGWALYSNAHEPARKPNKSPVAPDLLPPDLGVSNKQQRTVEKSPQSTTVPIPSARINASTKDTSNANKHGEPSYSGMLSLPNDLGLHPDAHELVRKKNKSPIAPDLLPPNLGVSNKQQRTAEELPQSTTVPIPSAKINALTKDTSNANKHGEPSYSGMLSLPNNLGLHPDAHKLVRLPPNLGVSNKQQRTAEESPQSTTVPIPSARINASTKDTSNANKHGEPMSEVEINHVENVGPSSGSRSTSYGRFQGRSHTWKSSDLTVHLPTKLIERKTHEARNTYLGGASLEDFVNNLEFDEVDGTTTKVNICETFHSLFVVDTEAIQGQHPSDAPIDLDSSHVQRRIKLGTTTLYTFLRGIEFDDRGITTIVNVVRSFKNCANQSLQPSTKVVAAFFHEVSYHARSGIDSDQ